MIRRRPGSHSFPFAILPLLPLLLLTACHQQNATSPGNLPTVQMNIGNDVYTLEVADNDFNRELGLMHRDSMPVDHGMIFVFDSEQSSPFWMKDTRIPLDILFIDKNGKVVSIRQMKPYDLSNTDSAGPYQYAIELNVNRTAQSGVKEGDVLKLPRLGASKPSTSNNP